MDPSIFLANAWGIPMTIIALAFLLNPKQIKSFLSFYDKEENIVISGMCCIVFGVLTLLLNNVWQLSWQTILTVLGWVAVLKGVAGLFWAEGISELCQRAKRNDFLSYFVLVAFFLGLVLVYFGITGA